MMTAFDNWISHNPADDPSPCDDCESSEDCHYDHIPEECGIGQPDPDRQRDEELERMQEDRY
jgi:hypothetical protein